MSSIKSKFFAKIKTRGEEVVKYNKPKFKPGDIIINTHFNVLSQIVEIKGETIFVRNAIVLKTKDFE